MISVIIPTHNRANLISRAIESVRKQTIDDRIEIIVVSDGSTDNTREVVSGYSDVRFFEYFPGVNGNHARNTGVKNAGGDYVAFLDDDDEWLPEKLSRQIEAMQKENAGLSYTGVRIVYDNEGIQYLGRPGESGDLKKRILIDNCIGSTSTVVVKKSLFEEAGGFDEKLGALQDYDLWIRLCQLTRVSCIPEPMILYHNYTNKKQVSSDTKKYEDAFHAIEQKYAGELNKLSAEEEQRRTLEKLILLATKCMRNGNRKEARRYARRMFSSGGKKSALKTFIASLLPFRTVLKLRSKL